MPTIIQTENLTYDYPAEEDQTPVLALDGVDVAIEKGTFVVVLEMCIRDREHRGPGRYLLQ